jgi:hypothetical protein
MSAHCRVACLAHHTAQAFHEFRIAIDDQHFGSPHVLPDCDRGDQQVVKILWCQRRHQLISGIPAPRRCSDGSDLADTFARLLWIGFQNALHQTSSYSRGVLHAMAFVLSACQRTFHGRPLGYTSGAKVFFPKKTGIEAAMATQA